MKRRDFIQQSLAGVFLPAFLNGYSFSTFGGITTADTVDDHVLVIIQLSGGNDGLNMVVPIDKYGLYQNARSNIAIPKNKLLNLEKVEVLGLNPAMKGIQSLYNEGKVALINSVGYPNPNFSHFRATDIWNTASDANVVLNTGWEGRFLNDIYPNFPINYPNAQMPDPIAIQIGSTVSAALQGPSVNMGMAITSPTAFYNLIQGKIEPIAAGNAGKELAYIRTVANQTNQYATTIKTAANKISKQVDYPTNNSLADQLKIVARLIGGGLKTKIYMVNMGGFDTHANQTNISDTTTGTHATLLGRLADAIKAFQDDLKFLNASKRVVGMTFSEFGRRIKSNASGGTDHGAAAPMFVFGDLVNGMVLGNTPDIAASPSVNDNVTMQYDFRSVYSSILENWFCLNSTSLESIMLRNYQSLPIIANEACGKVLAKEEINPSEELISNYPNPFENVTKIRFFSNGGHTMIQVFDSRGRAIAQLLDAEVASGWHEIKFEASQLTNGIYFARLQNGAFQQVRKMVK